jgi:aspartyl-tRNA(Asn)/glutamyl-tRNA(Gln) amidotransferase subunit B
MGAKTLGVRTEMKNLNSFRAIKRAVESESKRQISLLEEGSKVLLETRRWDEEKGESYPMRSKEEAKDYRYFPEPDLPPIQISEEWIGFIQGQRPEFREEKIERYQREYEIPLYDIELLCEEKALAELFEETTRLCGQPKKAANWLLGEGLRLLKEKELEEMPFSPEHLAELILLVEEGTIHTTMAKEIFTLLFTEDISPKAYVKKQGLKIITDEESLKSTVLRICEENPKSVEDYRKGKTKALGFLTGQTMKALKGQADPKTTQKILLELLSQIE